MQTEKDEKKTYQTPELIEYGSIEDITAGGSGSITDTLAQSNPA